MPIKPEMRGFYPINWPEISRRVRFERAAGMCQGCGRPHGVAVRCLPDGRWFDATHHIWRNGRGRPSRWPDLIETARMRQTRVVLAAAHLDHDPRNNRRRNLKSLLPTLSHHPRSLVPSGATADHLPTPPGTRRSVPRPLFKFISRFSPRWRASGPPSRPIILLSAKLRECFLSSSCKPARAT
jgi:hypothetical protein